MPTRFTYIASCLFTVPLLLSQKLQKHYRYSYCYYRHYHITLLLNYLAADTKFPGVVELTTQLLILKSILWLPLCRINKFGFNTLPSKTVAIPYTCGLSNRIRQNYPSLIQCLRAFHILLVAYLLFRCYCYNHYKTTIATFAYRYFHITFLLNYLAVDTKFPGGV